MLLILTRLIHWHSSSWALVSVIALFMNDLMSSGQVVQFAQGPSPSHLCLTHRQGTFSKGDGSRCPLGLLRLTRVVVSSKLKHCLSGIPSTLTRMEARPLLSWRDDKCHRGRSIPTFLTQEIKYHLKRRIPLRLTVSFLRCRCGRHHCRRSIHASRSCAEGRDSSKVMHHLRRGILICHYGGNASSKTQVWQLPLRRGTPSLSLEM